MIVKFIKKIKFFLFYRKTILALKKELYENFFIKIDWAYRLYTVLNIPEELIDEPYRNRKQDIDALSAPYIRMYASDLATFLNKNGLQELYKWYGQEKVGRFSYLLIIGYSQFETHKIMKRILMFLVLISVISYIFYYLVINNMI